MGNKNPKCINHSDQFLKYFCTNCNIFGCDKCSHKRDCTTMPFEYTFKLWIAELDASLGVIRNCTFAFNNVANSIGTMRDSLHDLYYSNDREIYYAAFEELVPYIKYQAVLLRQGLESITNYAVYMQNLLKNPPKGNVQKVADFWRYWKQAEDQAEILEDTEKFMLKLYDLNQIILSKEDAMVIPTFKQIKHWLVITSSKLLYKYKTILCGIKDNGNGFSWTIYVYMPFIKTILQYDNISPIIAYMLKILVHGNLYLCGNKPEMGMANTLLTVPLIKHEKRILFDKKPIPYFILNHTLVELMSRYLIVTGAEIMGKHSSNFLIYDILLDNWKLLPAITTPTLDEIVRVNQDRYLYIQMLKKISNSEYDEKIDAYVIDLLDMETGWKKAHQLKNRTKNSFVYVTENGIKFGNEYDPLYDKNGKSKILYKGHIFSENMLHMGRLTTISTLTEKPKEHFYAII